ncbi:hypothetical protein B0T19DRAFT_418023 [Cercophora scortea]|uniref:rRNA-processing protein EFG1 n=1 Tax=Cercophora scortea TaxID=314031 RepID=A0AAE0MI75_9PEZI|nr:hypothetical protein B0T19DRAFT_418023 [Cercophora scortea]
MGQKRSHAEAEASHIHPDRSAVSSTLQAAAASSKHKSKRQKVTDGNIGWIKKRARTIERLFEHDQSKVPADVQKDLERELAAHKQRILEDNDRKLRSRMISKYHMVRFFERKKAMRFAKQLQKQLTEATDPEEVARLKTDLHTAEVDIDYAINFPYRERYISLYTAPTTEASDEAAPSPHALLHTPRPPMWTTIEKTREEGKSALEKLRERRSDANAAPKKAHHAGAAGSSLAKKSEKKSDIKAEKEEKKPEKMVEERRPERTTEELWGKKPAWDKTKKPLSARAKRRAEERAAAGIKVSVPSHAVATNNGDGNDSDGGFFEED